MISCLPRGHSMTLHSLGLDHPAGYSAVEVFSGTSLGHFNPTDTFTGDVNPTGKCSWARIFFRRVASPPHFYILLMRVCDTHHCGVFSTFLNASSPFCVRRHRFSCRSEFVYKIFNVFQRPLLSVEAILLLLVEVSEMVVSFIVW